MRPAELTVAQIQDGVAEALSEVDWLSVGMSYLCDRTALNNAVRAYARFARSGVHGAYGAWARERVG